MPPRARPSPVPQRVRSARRYHNVAPQVGLVYSPGNHKTAIRAGFGIFYESDVFNNQSNARSNLLASGAFYGSKNPCTGGYSITFPDSTIATGINSAGVVNGPGSVSFQDLCQNRTIQQSSSYFIALKNAFQANTAANSISRNNNYIGNTASASGLYYPNYKQPYSEQWNFGVQREVIKGGVLSVDYIHNTALRIGQTLDLNHQGAARTFNTANATAAVNSTITACKGGATVAAIIVVGGCPGLHAGAAGSGSNAHRLRHPRS